MNEYELQPFALELLMLNKRQLKTLFPQRQSQESVIRKDMRLLDLE